MNVNLLGISPCSIKNCQPHSHSEWEIVLNLEGRGVSVIGYNEYNFYPGLIICQPPNIPHSKISKTKFKDIFIQVSNFVIPTNEDVPIFIDDEEKSFETLMFLALRNFHKKEKNYISVVNSLYEVMYQMLLSWNDNNSKNESVELFKNELVLNFTDPEFNISDAMKTTSYCTDHFRRCFKKETGITPISYLTDLRIEYAKKLLKQKYDTGITIAEISLLSGFYDSHYFSRVFKKNVGVAPQNFIKNSKKNAQYKSTTLQ